VIQKPDSYRRSDDFFCVTSDEWRTCDVEICSGLRSQAETVGRSARVPAGVVDGDGREHEAAVGVDGRTTGRGRRHHRVAAMRQPLVRHVVWKRFRLAAELDAIALERRGVLRSHHDVRVTCRTLARRTTNDDDAVSYATAAAQSPLNHANQISLLGKMLMRHSMFT